MPRYFTDFPLVRYSFGSQEDRVYFPKITTFVDVFDKVKQELSLYKKISIIDNERPDSLSYRLYGTVDYYWTFYLMNDKIKESGWPLTLERQDEIIKERYNGWVLTFEGDIEPNFPVGQVVEIRGAGLTGTVKKKNPDLGQVYLTVSPVYNGQTINQNLVNNYMLSALELYYQSQQIDYTVSRIVSVKKEYEAVHHYENSSGEYVDITPSQQGYGGGTDTRSGLTTVTWESRFKDKNDDLKNIVVIRPDAINSVVGEYKKALRR